MIGRMWHGWTTVENADTYENLPKTEIFPGIAAKKVPGYRGIQLFRRPLGEEIEFVTIMWFESLEDVKRFAGEDYEGAYVPPRAREVLSRSTIVLYIMRFENNWTIDCPAGLHPAAFMKLLLVSAGTCTFCYPVISDFRAKIRP
jgi:hypothetical protein